MGTWGGGGNGVSVKTYRIIHALLQNFDNFIQMLLHGLGETFARGRDRHQRGMSVSPVCNGEKRGKSSIRRLPLNQNGPLSSLRQKRLPLWMSIWWQVASRGFSMTLPPRAHATRSMELSATYELESSSSVLFSSAVSHSGSSSNSVIRLNMAFTGSKSHAFSYKKSRNFFSKKQKKIYRKPKFCSPPVSGRFAARTRRVSPTIPWPTDGHPPPSSYLATSTTAKAEKIFQFFPFKKKPFQKNSTKFNLKKGKIQEI